MNIQIVTSIKINDKLSMENQDILCKNIVREMFNLINSHNDSVLNFGELIDEIVKITKVESYPENNNEIEAKVITYLRDRIHQNAKNKGFHDKETEIGTQLMLIVSELGEALEADRKNKTANMESYYSLTQNKGIDFDIAFEKCIKDSMEDEIADTIIRLFDLCGKLNIDIAKHIQLKMQYNETREHKHGKKY